MLSVELTNFYNSNYNFENKILDVPRMITQLIAEDIQLIACRIADMILASLGPIGKANVAQKILKVKGEKTNFSPIIKMMVNWLSEENKFFFSLHKERPEVQACRNALVPLIEADLKRAFQNPIRFIETGIHFPLSEIEPQGLLLQIPFFTSNDVPANYVFRLKVNLAASKKHLVVTFSQRSGDVEFLRRDFNLEQIKEETFEAFTVEMNQAS